MASKPAHKLARRLPHPEESEERSHILDPQVARELGIVAAHLLDEPLGVLAPHERLDGIPERVVGATSGRR